MRAVILILILSFISFLNPLYCRVIFDYPQFTTADNQQFSPVNAAINDTSKTIQLTTFNPGASADRVEVAAIWYRVPVHVESFESVFVMRLSNYTYDPNAGNRDGIAFVIQTVANSGIIGEGKGGIGYGDNSEPGDKRGITNSVAIEFDTYYDVKLGDPRPNHISVHTLGAQPNSAGVNALQNPGDITSIPSFTGATTTITVRYANNELSVNLGGFGNPPLVATNFDLSKWISLDSKGAWVGFTSSSMGPGETQEILSWKFTYLGSVQASKCVAYGQGLVAGEAGRGEAFTIQSVDQFGYNLTEGGLSFEVSILTSQTITESGSTVNATIVDNGDGTYLVTYNTTLAADYQISVTLNGTHISGSPWSLTISPAEVLAANCVTSGSLGGVAGQLLTVFVQPRDVYNNNITQKLSDDLYFTADVVDLAQFGSKYVNNGVYEIQYSIEKADIYTIEISLVTAGSNSSQPVMGSPFHNCVITPSVPSAENCFAIGNALGGGIAGHNQSFALILRDGYNNTIISGLAAPYALVASIQEHEGFIEVTESQGGDGTKSYSVEYSITTSGEYHLQILLSPDNTNIMGSPFTIQILPGELPWGPQCMAYGQGLLNATAGREAQFTIQVRDIYGNNITNSSAVEAHFVINLVGEEATPKEAATNNNVQINITRQEQGMYLVQYMTTHAMFYKANISLDGRPIMDSPFELEVFPGPVYPYGCYAEGSGLTHPKKGRVNQFTVHTLDQFGNGLLKGGAVLAASIKNGDKVVGVHLTDLEDGTYKANYELTQDGHFMLSVTIDGIDIQDSPWFFSIEQGGGGGLTWWQIAVIVAGALVVVCAVLLVAVGLGWRWYKRRHHYDVLND